MQPLWWLTKDGDRTCLAMYERHYSAHRYADGRVRRQFVGPGEHVVLRTFDGDAFFVWRKFIDDCRDERTGERQVGVNCAAFRNESPWRSSDLIRQADAIADCLWPDCRHYTYVDAARVRSANPGFCFLAADWRRCGRTKGGLIVLERSSVDSGPCGDLGTKTPQKPLSGIERGHQKDLTTHFSVAQGITR